RAVGGFGTAGGCGATCSTWERRRGAARRSTGGGSGRAGEIECGRGGVLRVFFAGQDDVAGRTESSEVSTSASRAGGGEGGGSGMSIGRAFAGARVPSGCGACPATLTHPVHPTASRTRADRIRRTAPPCPRRERARPRHAEGPPVRVTS